MMIRKNAERSKPSTKSKYSMIYPREKAKQTNIYAKAVLHKAIPEFVEKDLPKSNKLCDQEDLPIFMMSGELQNQINWTDRKELVTFIAHGEFEKEISRFNRSGGN